MHDLQLVGVHDDGEHLVLTGGDGQRYRVRIDEPLRAAVRRDRARLGQLQIEMGDVLRPRDIQARIRAGETAEDVAASSGLPLEHVRRYEGPVLAERAHVADLARRLPARQVANRPPFAELVAERLTARGVDARAATWDAWRRDQSTWTVQLAFRAGTKDRTAQWAYDVERGHLDPLDDEARWLSASTAAEEGPAANRRLAAVSERVYDVEADGGVRPAAGQPGDEAEDATAGAARTLDLLDALRGRRGRRQPVLLEDDDLTVDDDLIVDDDAGDVRAAPDEELPPPAHPPASRPEEATDAEVLALADMPGDDEPGPPDAAGPDGEGEGADEAAPEPAAERGRRAEGGSRSSRNRRASVPSWDEIVFGAKRE